MATVVERGRPIIIDGGLSIPLRGSIAQRAVTRQLNHAWARKDLRRLERFLAARECHPVDPAVGHVLRSALGEKQRLTYDTSVVLEDVRKLRAAL